jgi:hypothetical protein
MAVGYDFVIPVCRSNIIIRTTIESVIYNYSPRCIYIITNSIDKEILEQNCKKWELSKTNIVVLDENSFFMKTYNLSRADINNWYTWKDANSREFGWWFQQILKLGAFQQIENLSDPYVVWDSDLIVLDKWELFPTIGEHTIPRFAILQESAKNELNRVQYADSIKNIIGLDVIEPTGGGTFVPHHFIFHHRVLQNMFQYIEFSNICELGNKNWMQYIMELSSTYYRFSEYKCVATYMNTFFPELLQYYTFHEYGKRGIRYRESALIIEKIRKELLSIDDCGIYRVDFMNFVENCFVDIPSYIQIEHV